MKHSDQIRLAEIRTTRGTLTFWASWYGWGLIAFALGFCAGRC